MATDISTLRSDTAPAVKPKTIFTFLQDPRVEKGIAAVASKYLTPDRFLRLAINAVKKTPLLLQCDPQTVLGAFMASAALGLEPNTQQQQAFLIPYKRRAKQGDQWVDVYDCQFQVGYRGFVTLAHRSPYIRSLQAESIHEGDEFDHQLGSESFLKYKKALKDRGDLIGAFSYVRLNGGDEMALVLPLDEILKIRSKSQTFTTLMREVEHAENEKERKKAEQKLAETPWVMWLDDMAAKSAIKKHAKQLPLTPDDGVSAAAALDDDSRTVDMAAMSDPDVVRSVVQDGYEPPALEDSAAPTMDMRMPHQEKEPLVVHTSHGAADAHAERKADQATGHYMDANKVLHNIQNAKDHDVLAIAADSISECHPSHREELTAAYRKRLDELDGVVPVQPQQPTRRRAPINAE